MNDEDRYSSLFQSNSYALKREQRFDHFSNKIRDVQISDNVFRIDK
jgi:hypothetical protein